MRVSIRRFAYAIGAAACLLAVTLVTSAEDRVLGEPRDFERLARAPFGQPRYVGRLENTELEETSGLAASRLQDDLLWAVNDSGNEPILYAIGADGRDRGSLRVEGAKNRDWEDIASYQFKRPDEIDGLDAEAKARPGRAYLLIADTGNNRSRQKQLTLYAVEEPVLQGERFPADSVASLAWHQEFSFQDGARDAEGIGVDVAGRRILIVGKRNFPAEVYALPLPLSPRTDPAEPPTYKAAVAARIALLSTIPQPTQADLEEDEKHGENRSQPTALDIAPDGRSAMILTYKHAYYYPRALEESWEQALSRTPQLLEVPPMRQAEGGAFDRSGQNFFVTTEKRPTPLFRIPRK
jgi:hypothetical protein